MELGWLHDPEQKDLPKVLIPTLLSTSGESEQAWYAGDPPGMKTNLF